MLKKDNLIFSEKRVKRPSAAFYLIDDFTNEPLMDKVQFSIEGIEEKHMKVKPIMNRSGCYLFFSQPPGKYKLIIEAEHFEKFEKDITIEKDKYPDKPEQINFIPLPSYPFPNGATLFRGAVFEKGTKNPIDDVKVRLKIKGKDKETTTDGNGEFVIYLPRLKDNMIKKVNGSYLVKGDNDVIELTATFSKKGYEDDEMLLVKEGSETKIERFNLEVGKEFVVKKYLKA